MTLKNPAMANRAILQEMYDDSYFPDPLVDQLKQLFVTLCEGLESDPPQDLDALYARTHAVTEEINDLQNAFADAGSEIETGAREALGAEFAFVAAAYGFEDADIEELIATRDW